LQTFIACRIGRRYVGFVLATYGFAFLVGSYVIGILKRSARRLAFLWAATAFFAGVLLTARLMTSSKMADDPPLFYVLASVWGLCSGVWDTLMKSELVRAEFVFSWVAGWRL
jgi:predicted MFS family arabinose efflux permease